MLVRIRTRNLAGVLPTPLKFEPSQLRDIVAGFSSIKRFCFQTVHDTNNPLELTFDNKEKSSSTPTFSWKSMRTHQSQHLIPNHSEDEKVANVTPAGIANVSVI